MERVSKACEFLKTTNLSHFQKLVEIKKAHWLVSERYKLVACKLKKVGHTSIARTLFALDGENIDSLNLTQGGGTERREATLNFTNLGMRTARAMIHNYTKFMFVRDPFERLVSGYRDNRPAQWFKPTLSFHQYALLVLDATSNSAYGNPHTHPYVTLCNPCEIKYDYIGMLDNFDSGMRTVLEFVGADKNVVLERDTFYQKNRTKNELLQKYLKLLPKSVIEKLYVKYFWDYFIFGFPKPDY